MRMQIKYTGKPICRQAVAMFAMPALAAEITQKQNNRWLRNSNSNGGAAINFGYGGSTNAFLVRQ